MPDNKCLGITRSRINMEINNTIEESLPIVLVLGDFAHEGLSAKIESLGFKVINKRLRSSPNNWKKIIEIIDKYIDEKRLTLVFVYLPTPTLLLVAEEEYDEVRIPLMSQLERANTLFFVYEDNLSGSVEPIPWELPDATEEELEDNDIPWKTTENSTQEANHEEWFRQNKKLIARTLSMLEDWSQRNIEVLPFRKRSDVTIRMFQALEDAQSGVFLRLYVPHGRYQSEQLEDFLTLFNRYLRDVEGKEFSVDIQRTKQGTTYVFKGRGDVENLKDLHEATERFDRFLVLAQNDPNAAERFLLQAGTSSIEAGFIIAKYSRSFRRLLLETRHEFERKRLMLVQQMEAELLDFGDTNILPTPTDDQMSALFSVVGNNAPVTINVAPGSISVNSQVAIENIVSGGIKYTNEDRAIMALLSKVQNQVDVIQLRSDLDRLKDSSTSPEEKRTAVQKLKGFLYSAGSVVGKSVENICTEALVAYLNSLINGG